MAIIKCKMCGGDLNLIEGASTAECEFCGSVQTVPKVDDEKKLTLFARANRLRAACEFDKAAGIYEAIVADFPEEAEAYWGLVLCKYGIEYVDDPGTGKKIPTCHRSSFESIMEDGDFEQALENADGMARRVYREEAKQIEEIRKGIIAVSANEEPYDIFICYKETDEKGERTLDSVMAQDIYKELIREGYRVFFARISLEDKLGQEYEPYIFAALNSAKIMLVIGTDYEYFNAVWVKNEWSRFLKLMAKDKDKHLIPCYKGIDAYDMPKEFNKLQAQDLGKVGAVQDLLHGIEKLLPRQKADTNTNTAVVKTAMNDDRGQIADLLTSARIHLAESNWKYTLNTCNQITQIDPSNAWAYVYQLARVMRINDPEKLGESTEILSSSSYYEKALKYADPALAEKLKNWCRSSEENCRAVEEACAPGRARAMLVKSLLSGGKEHIAAVLPDGTVTAMGSNDKGQCDVYLWRDIIAVACGGFYTVGLRSDGTVVACGDNEFGQCNVESWQDIVAISCDENHTAGLRKDGTVVACGKDAFGKLDVTQWQNIREVSCGFHSTVALKNDGTAVACGSNRFGQCDVTSWTDISTISCCNVHAVGLKKNGRVVACGDNEDGRCKVTNWRNVVDIALGTHHTVGLLSDGTLVACGSDSSGKCSGTRQWDRVVSIAHSFWTTLAIREDGRILVCGSDAENYKVANLRLFNSIDTLEEERAVARKIRQELDVREREAFSTGFTNSRYAQTHLAAGQEHIVYLTLRGRVLACGSNEKGQCNVAYWRDIKRIACGEFFTLAVHENGTVLACGNNEDGQCEVKSWRNITDVACGYKHAVGLRADGTVVACGNNAHGQCEVQNWTNVTAVACGCYHTVGLCADGTVLTCGSNEYGQCNTEVWKNIVAISANNIHTVGLQQGGRLVACGSNEYGECDVNSWQDVVSVSCGSHHTLGLKRDGTVVACGHDGTRRTSGTKDWKKIAGIVCGLWFSLGIRTDGSIVACGEMENGKRNAEKWRLFKSIYSYEKELNAARNFIRNMVRCSAHWRAQVSQISRIAIDNQGKIRCENDALKDSVRWKDIVAVAGTERFAVGLKKNGTVVYCGKPSDGSENVTCWEDIVQIECYGDIFGKSLHVVGLRQDGTVVACGSNQYGQCNVSAWTNIVRVYCRKEWTLGLRADGTVVVCGNIKDYRRVHVNKWQNIADIACGTFDFIGLCRDGSVKFNPYSFEFENLDGWKDIIQIAVGSFHAAGLRSDGTVVACGENKYGQCNVESWRDIVSIACGSEYTVGIHESGKVLFAGKKDDWLAEIQNALLVKVENGYTRPFVLCRDGTINGYWNVYDDAYKALQCRETEIPTDPIERAKIHEQAQLSVKRRASGVCQHCGGNFKGMLTKKCALCEIEKDY